MSLEIESTQKAIGQVWLSDDQLAQWEQRLGVWEVEVNQAQLCQVSIEEIASLLSTLCDTMRRLTRCAAGLLNAERASIFLLDQPREVLVSIVAEDGDGGSLVIETPLDRSIAGLSATSKEVINVPVDVYDDPRSLEAQNTDKKTGYRTYSILAWPLLNEQQDLFGVVQFINKLKPNFNPQDDLSSQIDIHGFTTEDEILFAKFAPSILQTIKRCQDCYQLTRNIRENTEVA